MLRRTTLIFLFLMMVFSPLLGRDGYRSRRITTDDGLTSNAVRNIVQDEYGFIWFGTDNGLCRYDGTKVSTYLNRELGINQYVSALLAAGDSLYIGTEHGLYSFSPATMQFRRLPPDIHATVLHLSADKEGNLWAATLGHGIWMFSPATGRQQHYPMEQWNGAVAQVYVDHDNQVWAITNWGQPAVCRLNRLHRRFDDAALTLYGSQPPGSLVMLQTRDGRLWIGSWERGLLQVHPDGRLEPTSAPTDALLHIHTLSERADGSIYVGSDTGIFIYDPLSGRWDSLSEKQQSERFVYAITSDTEGGLWIGTYYDGVYYISPVGRRFEGFTLDNGLAGSVVSRFCEDQQGRVWVASDDGGLMCFLPQQHTFTSYPHQNVLSQLNVHALCADGDELWIGTYTDGIYVLNTVKNQLRHYTRDGNPGSIDDISSYAICRDSQGRIWVATVHGLNEYMADSDSFRQIEGFNAMTIDIDEDGHNLWLSTQGNGLWCYSLNDGGLKQYTHQDNDSLSLADDMVNCALVDESGTLWVGTLGGLCRYDASADAFRQVSLDVPSQNIVSIIEDRGVLWLATDRGIVRYMPGNGTQRFTRHDGLVSEQFLLNAGMKASDGRIYLGTTAGFNTFMPYDIKANNVMPPVYITGVSSHLSPLATPTSSLELSYMQAQMISFSFAALSYCSPQKNQYAYKLDGFDPEWIYVGNQTQATYTNLPSGTYTFRVRATNNDGVWSDREATLNIVVQPPLWWSWWARLLYMALAVAAVWYYVRFRLRRAERQHQQELTRIQEQQEKEAREARLSFFTTIAHEIRTPVSLIIGPLEKISGELKTKEGELGTSLNIIDRNAHRLLELVNQLLDFRKVEQQNLVMHFAPHNICQLLHAVCERFAPTFRQGGRQFDVEYPDEHFTAIVDGEGITKIVSNLLTNANKYTKTRVRLRCLPEPDGDHFRLEVSDDGLGIREEDHQRIFDPFFQAQGNKPGTGIGLSIVKNIVSLHQGTISVKSEIGRGSTFTIVLPVMQEMTEQAETTTSPTVELPTTTESSPQPSTLQHQPSRLPTLLIVDDSEDMVAFLTSTFSSHYHVMTAADGVEALALLGTHEVSLIISDWMMPRMDGATLCRRVRSNQLTSHIPFVMLTAKTDDDSKVEGMDVGADAYVEKPFSVQYLQACIRNILEMRRRLMKRFATETATPPGEMATNPVDDELLTRMNRLIEDNLSDSALNVNFLAAELGISRSGLFAKIKSLTDATPNEMIQIVRLRRAAQLLTEGNHLVSEVAYMVGFSNPSYFTKCFQRQFGMKPAEYISKKRP